MSRLLRKPIILEMNIVECCLALAAATMPFSNNLNSYAIVLFCIATFFSNSFKEKKNNLSKNLLSWLLPVAYFSLLATSHFWDNSPNRSSSYLETGSSLLVFPIILGGLGSISKRSIRTIIILFALTNLGAALYCAWKAYLEYKATDYINVFFYHHISKHIDISAIYFSAYCVLSIVALYFYFFLQKTKLLYQLLIIPAIIILVAFTILLSSKMFIFLLYISGIAICMYSFLKFRRNKIRPLIIAIFLVAIPMFMLRLPYVSARIMETQVKKYVGTGDDQNGFAVRGLLWEKSWKLIKEHPLSGFGYYTAHDRLREEYRLAGFEEGIKQNYNSHNQYLFSWLCYGITGLILLIAFNLQFLIVVIRKKQFLGVYIILLLLVSMMTDCMLEIQKGIVFLMLLGGLFVFNACSSKERDSYA